MNGPLFSPRTGTATEPEQAMSLALPLRAEEIRLCCGFDDTRLTETFPPKRARASR